MTHWLSALTIAATLAGALLCAGCSVSFSDPSREFAEPVELGEAHPDIIHRPDPVAVWRAPLVDDPDVPKRAACVTCHGPDTRPVEQRRSAERFHPGMQIEHGDLSCDQCHSPDRRLLHTANGDTFDYSEVMRLCGQCHGPQHRDYRHGSHGGMNGYWDRRVGPRTRNNCTDCHTPHAPAYPQHMPVFRPADRFLRGQP